MKKFPSSVSEKLKYYVYLYSHPVSGEVIYVGKGQGNRVFTHLGEVGDSEKIHKIQGLKAQGLSPKIEILVHGISDSETALKIESAVIDLIGIQNLTNVQAGYSSSSHGRMSVDQLMSRYVRKKAVIREPAMLIKINQAFRYNMSAMELYDYTRGQWTIDPNRAKKVQYAFAVYGGVIQEVYEVLEWYKAGKTFSVREQNENIERGEGEKMERRYEFVGNLAAPEVRRKYRHRSVEHFFKPGARNPILYVNV